MAKITMTLCDICGKEVNEHCSTDELITPIKWYHLGRERERWMLCPSCAKSCAQYARAYSRLDAEGIANEIKRLAARLAEVDEKCED